MHFIQKLDTVLYTVISRLTSGILNNLFVKRKTILQKGHLYEITIKWKERERTARSHLNVSSMFLQILGRKLLFLLSEPVFKSITDLISVSLQHVFYPAS